MVEHQLPKLDTGVRFPSSAVMENPLKTLRFQGIFSLYAEAEVRSVLYDTDSDNP